MCIGEKVVKIQSQRTQTSVAPLGVSTTDVKHIRAIYTIHMDCHTYLRVILKVRKKNLFYYLLTIFHTNEAIFRHLLCKNKSTLMMGVQCVDAAALGKTLIFI